MEEKLDKILRETLFLEDNFKITDDLFVGSIVEWDSLAHMNLIYNLNTKFDISISFTELSKISNWGELKKLVISKAGGNN